MGPANSISQQALQIWWSESGMEPYARCPQHDAFYVPCSRPRYSGTIRVTMGWVRTLYPLYHRRYPDLLVHRMVRGIAWPIESLILTKIIPEIAKQTSSLGRRAIELSRVGLKNRELVRGSLASSPVWSNLDSLWNCPIRWKVWFVAILPIFPLWTDLSSWEIGLSFRSVNPFVQLIWADKWLKSTLPTWHPVYHFRKAPKEKKRLSQASKDSW